MSSMSAIKDRALGYGAVLGACWLFCGCMITSQLLGRTYPRFEFSMLRFIAQTATCSVLAVALRKSIFDIHGLKDVGILFTISLAYVWAIFTMNVGPLFAPVGNLESVCITVYILMNIGIGVARRKVTCTLVLAGAICCTGVVCLMQPDILFPHDTEVVSRDPCPCATLQGNPTLAGAEYCLRNHVNQSKLYLAHGQASSLATSGTGKMLEYNQTGAPATEVYHGDSPIPGMKSETFGYLLMVSCGITFCITNQATKEFLLPKYHYAEVFFWYGAMGFALSAVAMFALETPRFAGGKMCITFILLHCLFASCVTALNNASLSYISAEENSILYTIGIVSLFIAQSTFLVNFQPPRGNAIEYFGAVLVVLACLLDPVYSIVKDKYSKHLEGEKNEPQNARAEIVSVNEKTVLLHQTFSSKNGNKYSV